MTRVMDAVMELMAAEGAAAAIVPVTRDGQSGVFYGSFAGDERWNALATDERNREDVAIACCKLASALSAGYRMCPPRGAQ